MLVCAGVALAILLAAFVADGGLRLEPTTNVGIGFMLAGAGLCCAALLHPRARALPASGTAALLAFAALAGLTAISIVWSLAPSDSWVEAARTLSYLSVFAGGLALARLAPGRWPAVLHGIALGCAIVCGYALLTKVFPGALAADERFARLRAPFGYWNAVGLMAAVGVPPLLWLGARRSGHAAVNALAWPGIALLLVCLMLSYSRGAIVALGVGLVVWFAVVPLRLRGAVVLLGALAGAVPIVAWSFGMTGLSEDDVPVGVRADAGHELGALLLVMAAALLAAGLVAGFLATESPPSPGAKRLAGRVLIVLVALIPVAGGIALASSPGGIDGQLRNAWSRATDPEANTPANTPARLTATSSVRARYWEEAFDVHATEPWLGAGAGAYGTARTRFRTGKLYVRHAHGYVPQTLADLGWAGMALSLLTLGLWGWTAARATGLRRRDRGLPWDAERVGLVTLGSVAVVFGVSSALDWTWFVPANAAVGLFAAGWVAGRPPLRDR
ncbi:MAG TPA: O-antigen ligase family protein, partial [Solirubrobacteraceae bacterium]|nr:O-antigen ligase family protein [Solirubrobacteraceae bacterium]